MKIKTRLEPGAREPIYAHDGDAGADLRVCYSGTVGRGKRKRLHTGVCVEIPSGYFGLLVGRSGLHSKGVDVMPGIIDSGYRGAICCTVHNFSDEPWAFRTGDRVAQLLIVPVVKAEYVGVGELEESERGDGGFGSTGVE